jgi:hypothetical protein
VSVLDAYERARQGVCCHAAASSVAWWRYQTSLHATKHNIHICRAVSCSPILTCTWCHPQCLPAAGHQAAAAAQKAGRHPSGRGGEGRSHGSTWRLRELRTCNLDAVGGKGSSTSAHPRIRWVGCWSTAAAGSMDSQVAWPVHHVSRSCCLELVLCTPYATDFATMQAMPSA